MEEVKCPVCGKRMLPFSDFSNNGVSIRYKAWACVDTKCRYVITIRGGDIYYSRGHENAKKDN